MKISVLIIAHNEADNIRACLESIQRQTLCPDEIILVAHNCTDNTVEVAREFSDVRIVEEHGPEGPLYARIRGFGEATGEIIACIDGDSVAAKNWLQRLISRSDRRKIAAVGGGVWLRGGLRALLMSLDFFWLKPIYAPNRLKYFWGANFCIRKDVYEKVGGLVPLIKIREEIYQQDLRKPELYPSATFRTAFSKTNEHRLGLSFDAEDLYLALRVSDVGRVEIDPWAVVTSRASKTNWKIRTQIQGEDKQKLITYIKEGSTRA